MKVMEEELMPETAGIWVPNDGTQMAPSRGLCRISGGPVGVGQRQGGEEWQGSSNITCLE